MKKFLEHFNTSTITHILNNYSAAETGLHHPNLPCGIVFRDQGQTDVYSGKARLILSHNGDVAFLGKNLGMLFEYISLKPNDITNLKIIGRHFNPNLHNRKKTVLSPLNMDRLKGLRVIDPATTFVDPTTYKIVNDVPLSSVIEELFVFEEEEPLKDTEQEKYELIVRSL